MGQFWKFSSNTCESELGTFNHLAVSVRLDYIKRVFGNTIYLEEERLPRDLLARSKSSFEWYTPQIMLNLAHNLHRQRRYNEAEEIGDQVLSLVKENESLWPLRRREDWFSKTSFSKPALPEERISSRQDIKAGDKYDCW